MGYIQQSATKKLYAYLTQKGREKIITGDTIDFQIKYFSLHDDDINYKIASKLITAATYNTLKSGFIPDITGDIDNCLPVISDAINLERNQLVGVIQVPQLGDLTATTVGTCSTDGKSFNITVSNLKGAKTQQPYWYVKTQIISFPTATATLQQAIVLSTLTSNNFTDFNAPKPFKATFNFSDTYLPRKADSYNYTVYLVDGASEIEIGKFTDINCSKRIYGWTTYQQDVTSDYPNGLTLLDNVLFYGDNYVDNTPIEKVGIAAFVIDNGNRRRDLNITDQDLTKDFFSNQALLVYLYSDSGSCKTRPSSFNVNINFNAQRTIESNVVSAGNGQNSESVRINGIIIRPEAEGQDIWQNQVEDSLVPANITNNPTYVWYKGSFDLLHPTVEPFSNMGLNGFQIQYIEIAPKKDPSVPTVPIVTPGPQPIFKNTTAVYNLGYDGGSPIDFIVRPSELGNEYFLPPRDIEINWPVFTNQPCN